MTSPHKIAEKIVKKWEGKGYIHYNPYNDLVDAIELALTQAYEKGKKEMREKCVKIVEDFNYSKEHVHLHLTENDGKTVSIVNQIAQRLREMK